MPIGIFIIEVYGDLFQNKFPPIIREAVGGVSRPADIPNCLGGTGFNIDDFSGFGIGDPYGDYIDIGGVF